MFRAECAGIDISDAKTDPLWQIIRNKAYKYRSPYGNRRFPQKLKQSGKNSHSPTIYATSALGYDTTLDWIDTVHLRS